MLNPKIFESDMLRRCLEQNYNEFFIKLMNDSAAILAENDPEYRQLRRKLIEQENNFESLPDQDASSRFGEYLSTLSELQVREAEFFFLLGIEYEKQTLADTCPVPDVSVSDETA